MTDANPPGERTSVPAGGSRLRAFHRVVSLLIAPFIIVSAAGGGMLFLRKTGLYERKGAFREAIQHIHSYEAILPYVGLIAVVLMLLAAITGTVLFVQVRRRRS